MSRGDCNSGIIEVLNLYNIQGDVCNNTVNIVLWHFNPVTNADHIISESNTPATNPRMVSLKINISTAAKAPNPVIKLRGDLFIRIEIIIIIAIQEK